MAVSRETLYEEVWAEPMTVVAKRYGVSSNFLARVCERLHIPRPARGYWQLLEAGRAKPRPSLPPPSSGDEIEWSREGRASRAPRALPQAPSPDPTAVSPRARTSRHPILLGALQAFDGAKTTEGGYLRPVKWRLVDLFVTQATLKRAVREANQIFGALEDRGHRVTFGTRKELLRRPELDERLDGGPQRFSRGWQPDRATVVYVGTVAIALTVFEPSERAKARHVEGRIVRLSSRRSHDPSSGATSEPYTWAFDHDFPIGRLCLRASSPYPAVTWEQRWLEGPDTTLASLVPDIVRAIEAQAPVLAAKVAEAERQAALRRQEEEVRYQKFLAEEAERQRVANVKASREELFRVIEAWGVADRIVRFFRGVEQRSAELSVEERAVVAARLERARALVGTNDPLEHLLRWRAPDER